MAKASAQTGVTVQPEGTCQIQCTRKTTVRIVLGLIAAGVLVTLVVVFAAPNRSQQHVSELKENSSAEEKLYELQTMMAKPIETKMPQPPPIGAKTSKSPVTPTSTTTSATTRTSPVEGVLYELQTMMAKPIETEMPEPPSIGAKTSNSPVTRTTTTTTATTTTSPDTSLRSCAANYSYHPSASSGVYTIYTEGRVPGRKVWCDMVTDGGGWTRFQRRQDGSVEFDRTWTEYRRGFGLADAECWLGNDDLHRLTTAQPSELRVDLFAWDGTHGYAKYSTFSVASASTNYMLHVGGYNGTIGDSLTKYHNSRQFSTTDHDNDGMSKYNCATTFGGGGGWWYNSNCHKANLNGKRWQGGLIIGGGIHWDHWRGISYSYKAAAMMTRPRK